MVIGMSRLPSFYFYASAFPFGPNSSIGLNDTNEMYSNQADLNLIAEMGITPDRTIRERKPSLKTVAKMFIFLSRTKRLAGAWKERVKIQESLVRKLEVVRGERRTTTKGRRTVGVGS